jgi:hypothetical protein
MMAYKTTILLSLLLVDLARSADLFNYGGTSGVDYGPEDWDEVSCNNVNTCVSCRWLQRNVSDTIETVILTIFVSYGYLAAWLARQTRRVGWLDSNRKQLPIMPD